MVKKMTIKYHITREALKNRDYKKREIQKVGEYPTYRDNDALVELLKILKKQ